MVFPAPLGPVRPSHSPGRRDRLRSSRTSGERSSYRNLTCRSSTLGCEGTRSGCTGSRIDAGASASSNVRTAAARLSSTSRNASPSGCTASKAANATSGSDARNTPSMPPSRTPGIASTSTARPATPARIEPAPVAAPRIDARVRRSRSMAARPTTEVLAQPPLAPVGGEVRQAGEIARQPCVELRASRDRSFGRPARASPRARGARRSHRPRGAPAGRARGRVRTPRRSHTRTPPRGPPAAGGTKPRTKNASSVSTSATVRARRSPLRNVAEPSGRERLDRAEEPDPDLGEHPEGGEVDDVPLRIAERRAGDREPTDRRHGHRDRGEPRDERGPGDQVGRRGHQGDVRGERAEARQHGQQHPSADRTGQSQQPAERRRGHGRPSNAIGATRPLGASGGSGRPVPTTRPARRETTRSASAIGSGRCAITSTVRPRMSRSTASSTNPSLSRSRCDVGSSRMRNGASLRKARASARRWRSPPLSRAPPSPICVAYPSGRSDHEPVRVRGDARRYAARRPRRRADPGEGSRRRCRGTATPAAGPKPPGCARARDRSRTAVRPRWSRRPRSGSTKRSRTLATVVFPAPVGPTSATVRRLRDLGASTRRGPSANPRRTSRRRRRTGRPSAPAAGGRRPAPGRGASPACRRRRTRVRRRLLPNAPRGTRRTGGAAGGRTRARGAGPREPARTASPPAISRTLVSIATSAVAAVAPHSSTSVVWNAIRRTSIVDEPCRRLTSSDRLRLLGAAPEHLQRRQALAARRGSGRSSRPARVRDAPSGRGRAGRSARGTARAPGP